MKYDFWFSKRNVKKLTFGNMTVHEVFDGILIILCFFKYVEMLLAKKKQISLVELKANHFLEFWII